VNSVRESTPQNMSTGRPSQPQRPPGSMHEVWPLGTTHLPLLSQPDVKPQRWPEGHCESFLQLTALCEPRVIELAVVCVCALPHATMKLKTNSALYPDARQNFLTISDRNPSKALAINK